jgi:hypothetical protein
MGAAARHTAVYTTCVAETTTKRLAINVLPPDCHGVCIAAMYLAEHTVGQLNSKQLRGGMLPNN